MLAVLALGTEEPLIRSGRVRRGGARLKKSRTEEVEKGCLKCLPLGYLATCIRLGSGPNLGPNIAHIGNKTQPPPENRPWRGNLESIFPIVKSIWLGAKRAEKIDDLFPKA